MGGALGHTGLVARYEMRLLARNRVFLALAALAVAGTPLALYGMQEGFMFWHQVALPCAIPAANAAVAGIPLSLLAVFAVGEWAAGERRADSLQALRVRPYGNGSYVAGKALGVFAVLAAIALAECAVVAAWHGVWHGSPFNGWYYLFYWAVQVLPALAFMVGLAMWVYTAVRHAFVAFALLVGFFFADVYWLSGFWRGAWDYLGTALPNVFSEVTGRVALLPCLVQRAGVALAGVAFALFAVVALRRAESSPRVVYGWRLGAAGMLSVALGVGACYWLPVVKDRQVREAYRAQCVALEGEGAVSVVSHRMVWEQEGGRMAVVDTLVVENCSGGGMERVLLYLNSGLAVELVEQDGEALPFRQDGVALCVEVPLAAGESREWSVRYSGHIDERACYLHVGDSLREATAWSNSFLRYGKRVSMVSDGYTFLTPECLWYPTGQLPYRSVPLLVGREFARFRLFTRHGEGLMAVSQGRDSLVSGGTVFTNGHPLAGLSLAVGRYSRRSIEVDGVLCEMYAFSPTGMFAGAVNGSRQGIVEGVRRVLSRLEETYGIPYPFSRLAVVETPAVLCSYFSPEGTGGGFAQPELLFAPESWCRSTSAGSMRVFVEQIRGAKFNMPGIGEVSMSDVDTVELEAGFLDSWFLKNFGEMRDEFPPMSFADHLLRRQWLLCEVKNLWSLAPMFMDYVGSLHSDEFPGIDAVAFRPLPDEMQRLQMEMGEVGVPAGWEAVEYLRSYSLRDALVDEDVRASVPAMLERKGSYLRRWANYLAGDGKYDAFVESWREKYLFSNSDFRDFALAVETYLNVPLDSMVRVLYDVPGVPTILVKNIRQVSAKDSVFLVFDVWNPSDKEGLLTCYVQEKVNVYELEEVENRLVGPGACGQMAVPLDRPCVEVLLHTNLSANLPATYSRYFDLEEEGAQYYPVVEQLATVPSAWQPLVVKAFGTQPGEIIVDNEDEGFRVVESKVRQFFSQGEYAGTLDFVKGEIYGWVPSVFSYAWGGRMRSFYAKMVGNGGSRVEWTAELPEGGEYDLYVHYLNLQPRFQQSDSVRYCYGLEQGELKAGVEIYFGKDDEECHVTVEANDGYEEDYYYHLREYNADWVPLGRFVLDAGKVVLKLYDRGISGRLIFADAVKWVKR